MSGIYTSKQARRGLRRRRTPLRYLLLIAVGAIILVTAGVAMAAIALHGRGTLVAPAGRGSDLQVSDIRLNHPLMPGGNADLLFSVRNPNAFGARIDLVTLVGALRQAKPAGCTRRVGGPVLKPAGFRLPRAEQVLVGAGMKKNVVVHHAFTLAASAKAGCGFTVEVEVSATQLTSAASPTMVTPMSSPTSTSSPASEPTTTLPITDPPPPASTATTNPGPTATVDDRPPTVAPPGATPSQVDCDPSAEVCPPTLGRGIL